MKILLVDDDPGVIQAFLPVLKTIPGATVRAATTVDKALEHAEALGALDVLVTDVVMEPMDGFTLRDRLKAKYPALQTVFVTGYDLTDYPEQTAGHLLLGKPVDADALRTGITGIATSPKPQTAANAWTAAPVPALPEFLAHTARPKTTPAGSEGCRVAARQVSVTSGATPAAAAAAPGAAASPTPDAPAANDSMVGATLGTFQIIGKLGDGTWGGVYEAIQTTMGRTVAMKVLAPRLERDAEEKRKFISSASAKANVQHPLILSVYEAGEIEGHCYFTHEYVDGLNLEDMASRGITLDEPHALQIVKAVTEAMSYLDRNGTARVQLHPHHLYLGSEGRPRIANIATWQQDLQPPLQQEMATLAEAVYAVLPCGQAGDRELRAMLEKMRTPGQMGYLSWAALLKTVKSLEPKVVPADAYKLSQQDAAAIRAVEEARKRQRRTLIFNLLGIGVLLAAIGSLVYWKFFWSGYVGDDMVRIPAGEFVYQGGESRTLPDFWIDRYETTIRQYAEFLEYLDRNPTDRFDHPNQPPGHRHEPPDWDIYYERAKAGKPVRGFQPISLDTPVMVVDWWDALAYAKWRRRRLPTEEEWEKAARGPKGNAYPWGNEFEPARVNSASDHQPMVSTGEGSADGWNFWSPVDAIKGDKSHYGVIGMGGNVREWTASWDETGKFPIVRGGSYESESNKVTDRVSDFPDTTRAEYIGFRTAASEAPTD